MSKILWYLKQLDLFKNLPVRELEKIESQLNNRACLRGEIVFDPDSKNLVFILKKGRAHVYQLTPEGKKVIIEILTPGSVFGDLGVDTNQATYVEATTDGIICSMEKNKFFSLMSRYPQVSEKLLRHLFARLVFAEKRISSLAVDNVRQRFIKLLLNLGQTETSQNNEVIQIKEPLTHEQLAQMLGVSRQTMTTIINQLKKQQLIKREGKFITFHKSKLESYIV